MRHKQNFSSACSTRRRRTRRVAIVFQSVSIAMLLCCKTAICLMARLHEKIDIIDALFHSHTPQHFACRKIGYIYLSHAFPYLLLLSSSTGFLWTCFEIRCANMHVYKLTYDCMAFIFFGSPTEPVQSGKAVGILNTELQFRYWARGASPTVMKLLRPIQ